MACLNRTYFIFRLRKEGVGYGPGRKPKCQFTATIGTDKTTSNANGEIDTSAATGRSLDEMQLSLTLASLRKTPQEGVDQLLSAIVVRLPSMNQF